MVALEAQAPGLPDAVLRPIATNAFESTVEQLAQSIRLGVFRAGEMLPPERALAERLGVGRGTVREAIAALRESGLVETRRGRGGGTLVTGTPFGATSEGDAPSSQEVADALDFRRVVEPGAAWLAAQRDLSAAQRQGLSQALAEVTEAPEGEAHRTADSRLHLTIASVCGSPMLLDAVTQAQSATDALLRRIPVLPRNIAHSHQQHQAIVRAVLAGDAARARAAMEEHVDGTSALLRGLIG